MSQAVALLSDAEASIKAGEWDQALELLESGRKGGDSPPELYEKLAHVQAIRGMFRSTVSTYIELVQKLVDAEDYDRAENFLVKVLSFVPESQIAREHRIAIERKRGRIVNAVALSRELARLCIENGDGDTSIRLLKEALQEQPENLDISLELAEMFVSHGQIEDGANQYRRAANAFQEQGNIHKAAESYRRMKVVQSDDPEVLLTLGRLYTELGKLDEAEQEFRSVLRHDLEHEEALMELGYVSQLKGRFRSGILAFKKVLQSHPGQVKAKRKLGELNFSQGMMDEAVEFFLEAAQGYLETEDKEQAIELFQIVYGIDSANATAAQNLANLGAPLEARTFTPPEPPELVAPPEPEPVAVPEPVGGGGGGAVETTTPSAGDSPTSEPPKPKARPQGPSGSETRRRGLVAGGLSLKPGLVDTLGGGGKPMLGGKPSLGGPGGGGRRRGLGAKTMGGLGGDKPMLGGRRPILGKPRLGEAQDLESQRSQESPQQVSESTVSGRETLEGMTVESPFGDTGESEVGELSFDDSDFEFSEDPFAEPSEVRSELAPPPESHPMEVPRIGSSSVSLGDSLGDSLGSGLRPGYEAGESSGSSGSPEDDLFDFDGSDDLFDSSGSESLFGDGGASAPAVVSQAQEPTEESFFDFDDDGMGSMGDDLFADEPNEGPMAAVETSLPGAEVASEGGTLEDSFGSLFDEEGPVSDSPFDFAAASEEESLFGETSEGPVVSETDDGGFDDLFGDATSESLVSEGGGEDLGGLFDDDDLFSDPSAQPTIKSEEGTGSFDEDLFGSDDLFGGPQVEEAQSEASRPDPGGDFDFGGDGLFAVDEKDEPVDDLFGDVASEPEGLFDGPQSASGNQHMAGEDNLFDSIDTPDDSLFFGDSGGQTEAMLPFPGEDSNSAPTELDFGPSGDLGSSDGGDLFATQSSGVIGEEESLFGDFGAEGSDEGDILFGEGQGTDLFAADGSGQDDLDPPLDSFGEGFGPVPDDGGLFGALPESETVSSSGEALGAATIEETGFGGELDSEDDLFGESSSDDLFSSAGDSLGEEDLFSTGSGNGGSSPSLETAEDFLEVQEEGHSFDLPLPGEASDALSGGDLFAEPAQENASDDLFGGFDGGLAEPLGMEFSEPEEPEPLDLDLPMPGDPPLRLEEPEPAGFSGPDSNDSELAMSEEFGAFEVPVEESSEFIEQLRAAEVARSGTSEAEEDASGSDEVLKLLELTLPKAEVQESPDVPHGIEAPGPETEAFSADTAPWSDSSESPEFGDPFAELEVDFGIGIGVDGEADPSFDEEPATQGAVEEPEIPKADLVSPEQEAHLRDVSQADQIDASLVEADVATKIAAYRRVLETSPDNLVLRTRLADIHLKYGLLEDAVVQFRQILKRKSDSVELLHKVIQAEFWNENYVEAGESLFSLAQVHMERNELHEALDSLQSVLSLDPLHFEARKALVSVFTTLEDSKLASHHLRQLAETAMTKGEVQEAISAFNQLLEISEDPSFEERLAQIYESQGDVEGALARFSSLQERYLTDERWEEAARVSERIVELRSEDLEQRSSLIELYRRLGDQARAVRQQHLLAELYQQRSEFDKAATLFETVVDYDADNHDARRSLVDVYLEAGRISLALEQARVLTEHYVNTGDPKTAISLYRKLVEADPDNADLQERLVKFYTMAGDSENAKECWVRLSQMHESQDRFEKAAEAMQRALELEEGDLELQYRLARVYAEKLKDAGSALTYLRLIFAQAPDRLEAVNSYIDLLLQEEEVAEAGQALQKLDESGGEGAAIRAKVISSLKASVESNPSDLKARFRYGELCYHLGDLDHAIEQFQQTRRSSEFELHSYNMLGLSFAKKRGYNMADLATRQFKKGLELKGYEDQDYLELRYNLAMLHYQSGRAREALGEFKHCYNVDITFKDVRSWIQKIEQELAASS